MTRDPEKDASANAHFLNAFFQNAVRDTRLLDPSRQFVPDDFDPDNLFDPEDSSIANAQKTANEAYTNGATKAAEALATAEEGIADLTADLTAETAARIAADATLTTNLATEATTRGDADTALDGRLDTAEADIDALQADVTELAAVAIPFFVGDITISGTDTTGSTAIYTDPGGTNVRGSVIARSSVTGAADLAHVIKNVSFGSTQTTITLVAAPGAATTITFGVVLFKVI